MMQRNRNRIQLIITIGVISVCIIYFLYISDRLDFKLLSAGELNPYGGWSALKGFLMDVSYRWRGFHKSIALTIGIAVTALLMGRFFCGFVCPIGALQDLSSYMGRRLRIPEIKLQSWKYFKFEMIKYFVFMIVVVLDVLGMGKMISPYSPWIAYVNVFINASIYVGSIILIMIILLSLFVKRIFCRVLCPLGAFQGLLSSIGILKIHQNENCDGCNQCLNNCPVDMEKTDDGIMSPECIKCLNCVESICIKGSEGYSLKLFNRRLNSNQYIIISLLLFFVLYVGLPMLPTDAKTTLQDNIGYIQDGKYEGEGLGFVGTIKVEVEMKDNKIQNIRVLEHSETSGYYQEVFKGMTRSLIKDQNLGIDAISGATATSRGTLGAVKDALSKGSTALPDEEASIKIVFGEGEKIIDSDFIYHHPDALTFQSVVRSSGKKPVEAEYRGIELSKFLASLEIELGQANKATFHALDGYQVLLGKDELNEPLNVYITFERDGEYLKGKNQNGSGPFQLVIRLDPFSQRWIKHVNEIILEE